MEKKPELGITNPYELNEKQYAAVLEVLRAAEPARASLLARRERCRSSDFKNDGVVATSSWGYMVNALVAEKQPVASTIPDEGFDGLGRHYDAARRRQERELRLQVDGVVAEPRSCRSRSASGSARCRWCPPRARNAAPGETDACEINGFDRFDKVHFWRTPQPAMQAGRLRALQQVGHRLRRRHGRALTPARLAGRRLQRRAIDRR